MLLSSFYGWPIGNDYLMKSFFSGSGRFDYYRLALCFYLLVFVTGFYLTELPSSRHSALIRGGGLLILATLLVETVLARGFLVQWSKAGINQQLIKANRPADWLAVSLLIFGAYFGLQSMVHGDWESFRRIVTLSLFVFVVVVSAWKLDFDIRWFAYGLVVLGGCLALAQGTGMMSTELTVLGGPLRKANSGLDGFASYENTIVAALFWSYLLLALVWEYKLGKNKILMVGWFLASCIVLLAIYHTAARTAWVASLTGLSAMFLLSSRQERQRLLRLFVPVLLMFFTYTLWDPDAVFRGGLTYRDYIWAQHLANMQGGNEWLFGKGLAALVSFVKLPNGQLAIHPHSIYVETLYAGGLIGLLLLVLVLGTALWCLLQRQMDFPGKSLLGAMLAGGCLGMVFDFNGLLDTPNLVWLWLWLPLGLLLAGMRRAAQR